jgi:hypothetical protein
MAAALENETELLCCPGTLLIDCIEGGPNTEEELKLSPRLVKVMLPKTEITDCTNNAQEII